MNGTWPTLRKLVCRDVTVATKLSRGQRATPSGLEYFSRCFPEHSLKRNGHFWHGRYGMILALGTIHLSPSRTPNLATRLLDGLRPLPLRTLRFAVSLRSQQVMPPRPRNASSPSHADDRAIAARTWFPVVASQQMQQQCIGLLVCIAAQFHILVKRYIPVPANPLRGQDYRHGVNSQSFILRAHHLRPHGARFYNRSQYPQRYFGTICASWLSPPA